MKLSILIERLKEYDEIQICELLDVSSEELVEAFAARIKERRAYITKELELNDPEEPEGDEGDNEGGWDE